MGGRSEPRNFASWPVEFGKIFRRKLWAPIMARGGYCDDTMQTYRLIRYLFRFGLSGALLAMFEKSLNTSLNVSSATQHSDHRNVGVLSASNTRK